MSAERNVATIRQRTKLAPKTAIVLGSGLGSFTESLTDATVIPYGDLDSFPVAAVSGHSSALHIGTLAGTPILVLAGRAHYYEHGQADVMRTALETLQRLGIEIVILTNAAGSLTNELPPGSVMLISDHINFANRNPLIGEPGDARFVGMTSAYDPELIRAALEAAEAEGIVLTRGVYMWFSGPSFETPAEIRAARILGADAVGMSTVPEVILARFFKLRVLAFSIITNFAAGMTGAELSHEETKQVAPEGAAKLQRIIGRMLTAGLLR